MDLGSTHTFISDDIAQSLDLPVQPHLGLYVKVANDNRTHSMGVCLETIINIHGKFVTIDCYVLPLISFNVIFRVHWLRTLGLVIWDIDALMMDF